MLMGTGGELAQPEKPSADAQEATIRPRVMPQRAAVHACINCLLGSEIASLRLGLPVERIVIYVRHIGESIT